MLFSTSSSAVVTAAVAVLASSAQAQLQDSYEKMLVFGASYADNGHKLPKSQDSRLTSPPYYGGRFSDGPVFTEHLANLSGIDPTSDAFMDHALAGAVVSNDLTPGVTSVWDIGTQVQNFIDGLGARSGSSSKRSGVKVVDSDLGRQRQAAARAHQRGTAPQGRRHRRQGTIELAHNATANVGGVAGSHSNSTSSGGQGQQPNMLLVLEIGLNTLKELLSDGKTSQSGQNVQKLGDALSTLTQSDAIHQLSSNNKFDIFVMPMMPLQMIPNWSDNGADLSAVSEAVSQWNEALKQQLSTVATSTAVQSAGDRVFTFDADQFWTQAQAVAGGSDKAAAATFLNKFGIQLTNAKDACYDGSGSESGVCGSQDSYFFWDSIHPTTVGHTLLANNLRTNAYQVGAQA